MGYSWASEDAEQSVRRTQLEPEGASPHGVGVHSAVILGEGAPWTLPPCLMWELLQACFLHPGVRGPDGGQAQPPRKELDVLLGGLTESVV